MSQLDFQGIGAMGTLVWGAGNCGELGRLEKVQLIGNLAYVQVREAVDGLRQHLGLLRPTATVFDDLFPPRCALVDDALQLAQETHEEALLFHSWRTYFFGAMLAAHERIEYDPPLFFAAAILHDVALTKDHSPHLCERCFALSGGDRVRDFLNAKGHPHEVGSKVGNAIALHLNGWVSRKRHGAEAHLVSRGAVCDLFGAGRRRFAQDTLVQVLTRFPRDGVIEALQFEVAKHRQDTRAAVMTGLSGGKAPPDPFRNVPGRS
ncbi:HD domain-containing protein [Acidovorax sp.]|uniref:HD domain-containing protein n=1 Tax=Acidovorax sp. TaxID=1872122 RepID=UPI002609CA8F|nr:HD domain-containing protein [Acidovorax sp.]